MESSTSPVAPERHHRAVTQSSRFFRVRLWMAHQLWLPVLIVNMIAVLLSFALPRMDREFGRTIPIQIESVQSLFSALAASMITFTGIVFSALFIAVQIQTSGYSPRLAAQLRRDWVIMGTLVLSTATAAYSMGALTAVDQMPEGSNAPFATALVGLILAIGTLAWFAALIQRTFEKLQIGGILRNLAIQAWKAIDDIHPAPGTSQSLPIPERPAELAISEIEHSGGPGVIAAIDRGALVRLAEATGGFVEVVPQVGEFISNRMGAVRIHGGEREPTRKQVGAVFVLARQRTTQQDPSFVIRILVDIAIRALSPAINDPTTAVQTIDRIESLMIRLHERHPGSTYVVDASGEPRGLIHAPTWIEYFDLASTEIRRYGSHSVQIHRRLRSMHLRLLDVTAGAEHQRVERELDQLELNAASAFTDPFDLEMAKEPDSLGIGGR